MQKFKNILFVCFISCLGMTFFSCHAQKTAVSSADKQETVLDTFASEKNKIGDTLPAYRVVSAQGKYLSNADLIKGQPILFVLFNPSCGHCQVLLEQVRDNLALYENVNIVFLTGQPLKDVLPNYVVNVKVDKIEQINVVSDNSDITTKIFEYQGIPQIMLYDKEHKLQFIYYKDATNKQILRQLRK